MQKPKSLRAALFKAVPQLKDNPDMLAMTTDNGAINATLAASLSFEKQYTLNLIITNFTGSIDLLLVPISAWLRVNQPDVMMAPTKSRFRYITDLNNGESEDIVISLDLTERTIVKEVDGALHVSYAPEPQFPDAVEPPTALYANGELVSTWHE